MSTFWDSVKLRSEFVTEYVILAKPVKLTGPQFPYL